jgi:hypothetical protein
MVSFLKHSDHFQQETRKPGIETILKTFLPQKNSKNAETDPQAVGLKSGIKTLFFCF